MNEVKDDMKLMNENMNDMKWGGFEKRRMMVE